MEQHENTDVLTRGRGSVTASQKNTSESSASLAPSGDNFTAHNPEFDRRTNELRKRMAYDKAAAEAELARLTKRSDLLKEFLFEYSSTAENLEHLNSIINAEKEFANRLEVLEQHYYKMCGKLFEGPGGACASVTPVQEPVSAPRGQSAFKELLPLVIAIVVSALIVAFTLLLVFL